MNKELVNHVPELRFPEFESLWSLKRVDEIADGKLSNGVFNDPKKIGSGYFLINVKDMYKGLLIDKLDLTRLELTEKQFRKNQSKFGDIFFTRSSLVKEGIAYSAINGNTDDDITFDGHLIKLSPKLHEYDPTFLGNCLKTYFLRKQIVARGKTGTMTTIGQEDLVSVKVPVPSLKEQQKIANFLTAIDQRITLLKQKKAALEQYKKGLMQKIFSQEIRFKDDGGNDFPDWEEKRLGDVANCLDNRRKPLNSTSRQGMKGSIPYYGANGVVDYLNDYLFDQELILLAEDGGNFDEFANRPIAQYVTGKSWVNNHAHVLSCKEDNIGLMLYYSLVHKDIRKYINGSSRAKLNKSDMLSIKLLWPSSIEEQQKIADCLSAIDQSINQLSKQIDQTTQFKKGLLQRMFV